ncbi:MAG TPA: SusC/RagA family TonB-linked outer membrane protein [Puia sp.]|jgi:TonB-linked SusC/RagA family outer membrane protein
MMQNLLLSPGSEAGDAGTVMVKAKGPGKFIRPKLLTLLLTLVLVQATGKGLSQKVTISVKDVPLKSLLREIQQQTGYSVLFNSAMVAGAKPVTTSASNEQLFFFLDRLFADGPFTYHVVQKTIFVTRRVQNLKVAPQAVPDTAARGKITGSVTDSVGMGLSGATIRLKPGTRSTFSKEDGSFGFPGVAPGNYSVEISFIGHETIHRNVVLSAGGTVALGKLALKRLPSSLQDVTITTGYGLERKKKELGYSVAEVKGEELTRASNGNILDGLQGKVAGLSITAQGSDMTPQMKILLRGIRSFGQNANNQPLFIFNGSPLSFGSDQAAAVLVMNFINNLNPADVENVVVIKGANGAALYGPEGSNGVIIINTKKGKGRTNVSFRDNTSFSRTDFRYDKSQQREFGSGDGSNSGLLPTIGSPASWGPAYNGQMVKIGYPDQNGQYQMLKYLDSKANHGFFNTALANRDNVSISSGDDNSNFYLGLGNLLQHGVLPLDHQDQATAILNVGRKMGKLSVQMNVSFSRTNASQGTDLTTEVISTPTFIDLTKYRNYTSDHWSVPDNYFDQISPYQQLANDRVNTGTNALTGNISMIWKPIPWLTVTERPGVNYSGEVQEGILKPVYFSAYARVNPNKVSDILPAVTEYTHSTSSLNNDLLVSTLNRTGDFTFRTNLGNSIRQNYDYILSSQAQLAVPVYNLVYSLAPPTTKQVGYLARTVSAFANGNVGWKDKYFVELTARDEWDSKLAPAARGKDYYFGANTSVIIKEAVPALKAATWLSTGRIRASFASSANMDIEPYQSSQLYNLSLGYPYPSGVISYQTAPGIPNPNLVPEKIFSQEYGGNFGLFRDRVLLDIAYYYQVNTSVILDVINPWLSGAPTIDNIGKLQNHGLEVSLRLNPLIAFSKDCFITLDVNFATNNNKILQLSPAYNGVFAAQDNRSSNLYGKVGGSAFQYGLTDFTRDPQGHVIVDRVSGLPSVDQTKIAIIGRTSPLYTASTNLGFVWKHLSAALLLDYSGGYQHYYQVPTYIQNGYSSLTTYNHRSPFVWPNSVYADGSGHYQPNTNVVTTGTPQALYSVVSQATIMGYYNASSVKVREFTLLYDLPLKSRSIRSLSVSIWGRDLFSFYAKDNRYGDPGLIAGPGYKSAQAEPNNLTGASSQAGTLPGQAQAGFTIGASF